MKMKKSWLIAGICCISTLTACQNDFGDNDGMYHKSGNTLNVNDQAELYNDATNKNGNINENFGYVRHQKSPIMGERASNSHYVALDREKLADAISKLCTDIPNVNDVSTLVADEEVLVIYDADTKDRNLTADQVKKTAMSLVPRWYHVYVSDNTQLRELAESYAYLDSDSENAENGIEHIIKEMKKSPQGEPVETEENANGES